MYGNLEIVCQKGNGYKFIVLRDISVNSTVLSLVQSYALPYFFVVITYQKTNVAVCSVSVKAE